MTIKARLERIEERLQPADNVYGVTYVNDGSGAHPPGVVRLCRPPHEEMSLKKFEGRYPHGTLIRIEFDKDWRNERQN